jgi:hypothetical protein
MKRISFHSSLVDATHFKNLLEHAGIRCTIKNAQLSGGLGEIPFLECSPEVWVLDERDFGDAERLLREQRSAGPTPPTWRCRHCGEQNEGQFAVCWRCERGDEP